MDISIFNVLGPVMIGPSSSHTAGAAKLSKAARAIVGKAFSRVSFGLHGSFAKTYKGHGTDVALVAGALGLKENDDRLERAFELADKSGLAYDFYEVELENMHENTVVMTFYMENGEKTEIIGASIGGGEILIKRIDGFDTELRMNSSTLLICQEDKVGIISEISRVLAKHQINIGVMTVNRSSKGGTAYCTIETDSYLTDEVVEALRKVPKIISVKAINVVMEDDEHV
ncbi:L-serine ammonia-lyase, iron-sulfur-dependent subunit beta [Acetivibrio ethanolgignens]|uniref:L-serine deaminase n=1 Tax=Acetivibrio ethanolgignens TaxID=290052 RepID=A0A0V8QCI4_9FIRM|nr:L-serine ammonia-lyase, iron-sulfur-dependent subunit beta [Acetivibrio ethanolgignens]KSV58328.1 serine dehydratase [Acetivibrio ethanolgignens]